MAWLNDEASRLGDGLKGKEPDLGDEIGKKKSPFVSQAL